MPVKLLGRDTRSRHLVKNRSEVLFAFWQILFGVIVATKEVGGGELLGVANDNGLPSSCYGADRVPGCDLRRFIEDYNVKGSLPRREVLRDRQRRHQNTWCEFGEGIRHF